MHSTKYIHVQLFKQRNFSELTLTKVNFYLRVVSQSQQSRLVLLTDIDIYASRLFFIFSHVVSLSFLQISVYLQKKTKMQ